jgi:ABC-2 type transport system permease protein
MPVFFLSGALFPLDHLPRFLGVITDVNPLSYGIDGLRGALIGRTHFGLLTDLAVLCAVAVVFLSNGSYFFSQIEI